ncbi:MAG: YhjD/YihY/BrkB family envelope integrity protein, partial [Deinococcales bacterium]
MGEVLRQPLTFAHRLVRRFQDVRLQMLAAALAYYAAFSLGPLLLLLAGWLGVLLRTNPELAAQYRRALDDLLSQALPLQQNTAGLVSHSFDTVLQELNQGALLRSALSFLVLVWASGNFFTSLQQALEVVFEVPRVRGFWRKRLVAVLLVLSVALVIAFEVVGGALLSGLNELSRALATWLAGFNVHLPGLPLGVRPGFALASTRVLVAVLAFMLTFRYLPREKSTWIGALLGALVSALGVLLVIAFMGAREYCRMALPDLLYESDRVLLPLLIVLPVICSVFSRLHDLTVPTGMLLGFSALALYVLYHYGRFEAPLFIMSRTVLGLVYVGFLAAHL